MLGMLPTLSRSNIQVESQNLVFIFVIGSYIQKKNVGIYLLLVSTTETQTSPNCQIPKSQVHSVK